MISRYKLLASVMLANSAMASVTCHFIYRPQSILLDTLLANKDVDILSYLDQ
jgi:hypothetical protein